jgi:hypothetical protein
MQFKKIFSICGWLNPQIWNPQMHRIQGGCDGSWFPSDKTNWHFIKISNQKEKLPTM